MYFRDCIVKAFLQNVFLKLCLWMWCKLRREVPFKLIFIQYIMKLLDFLSFFLTLRAWGMRRRWRQRRTRKFSTLFLFTLLLISFLSSSRCRLRRRRCATSFPCILLHERFAPFWTRISLDNSLLYFRSMRAILLILLIASFALYILDVNLCHFLNLHSVRASKVERGKWGFGLHFNISMTLREYNIWSKQWFYEIKSIMVITNCRMQ